MFENRRSFGEFHKKIKSILYANIILPQKLKPYFHVEINNMLVKLTDLAAVLGLATEFVLALNRDGIFRTCLTPAVLVMVDMIMFT